MIERLRKEPFRVLFPLAALLAWIAAMPWVLFGTGVIRVWKGTFHALTMTEGFLVAVAFGFLGTMLPRRTGAAPLGHLELGIPVAALIALPVCLWLDRVALAQLANVVVLGTLVQFALRRLRKPKRPPPASFVFLPLGVVGGLAGSILIALSTFDHPLLLAPGRALVEEGLLLSLVLALGPMLASIILHDRAAVEPVGASYRRQQLLHLTAAAALLGSFAVELWVSQRAGLLLRGAVVAVELGLAARLDRWPSVPGLHRRLFWLALVLVPIGELAAGARPAYRLPLLHLTFVGGFSLLVFAVSFHVVFLHTGNDALARRRPWPVAVVGALVVLAAAARVSAEHFALHYVLALAVASTLWLAGALVWGAVVVRLIVGVPPKPPQ